ncbi:hypothetical protein K3N28_05635 [Glycomyces sp. TRM65418]|uniref:hypothetical protein n=1 Tax=Glycomyces sp. TRM65418 TaxID=2867006 RepID=UPI001CE61313|nr:hypothetical protein [Glycomyces sp. TRM65418]MCC3762549.1 hypothetical protein [Glycomyces sp. TRM65418]QZD56588.1 hypothetical protein K3N28_05595 [Glycomyces sp. TRM65418]
MTPPVLTCTVPGELPLRPVAITLVILVVCVVWFLALGQALPLFMAIATTIVTTIVAVLTDKIIRSGLR